MNTYEIERIAAAMNQARPDWPIKQLHTLLGDDRLANRPRRDVFVALAWVAAEPDTTSPYRVLEAGPWWKATGAEGGEDRRWSPPKAEQACGKHPGEWRDRCRVCAVDGIDAYHDDQPVVYDRHPDRTHAIAEARAVMASRRAGLCRHGAATCTECDDARTAAGTNREAANAAGSEEL